MQDAAKWVTRSQSRRAIESYPRTMFCRTYRGWATERRPPQWLMPWSTPRTPPPGTRVLPITLAELNRFSSRGAGKTPRLGEMGSIQANAPLLEPLLEVFHLGVKDLVVVVLLEFLDMVGQLGLAFQNSVKPLFPRVRHRPERIGIH